MVRGASLTLGRFAISDPLRRYRGEVATGRSSLEAFEGKVVTVCEVDSRASRRREAQIPVGSTWRVLIHIIRL